MKGIFALYICALVGASGTGKSYRAIRVAKEHNIEYIIDDGLLIRGNGVVAGKSAKREKTKGGAVKTAVFSDDKHVFDVSEALKENNVERLLILGTSVEMVNKIVAALELPDIEKYIYASTVPPTSQVKVSSTG